MVEITLAVRDAAARPQWKTLLVPGPYPPVLRLGDLTWVHTGDGFYEEVNAYTLF